MNNITIKKKKKIISYEDAQMFLMVKLILDDQNAFRQYVAIRKVERDLSESMALFTNKHDSITMHDLTRWLMKKQPQILKVIDEAVDKIYKK